MDAQQTKTREEIKEETREEIKEETREEIKEFLYAILSDCNKDICPKLHEYCTIMYTTLKYNTKDMTRVFCRDFYDIYILIKYIHDNIKYINLSPINKKLHEYEEFYKINNKCLCKYNSRVIYNCQFDISLYKNINNKIVENLCDDIVKYKMQLNDKHYSSLTFKTSFSSTWGRYDYTISILCQCRRET